MSPITERSYAGRAATTGFWSWNDGSDLLHFDTLGRQLIGVDGPPHRPMPLDTLFRRLHADDREPVRDGLMLLARRRRRSPAVTCRVQRPGGGWNRLTFDFDHPPVPTISGSAVTGAVCDAGSVPRAPLQPVLPTLDAEEVEAISGIVKVGIWQYDAAAGTVRRNACWEPMLGYDVGEIAPTFEGWAGLLHPDDHDRVLQELDEIAVHTCSTFRQEYRLRHRDGSYRWMSDRGRIVQRDADNRMLRSSGLLIDITDEVATREAAVALSSIDPLTGIGNRRRFEAELSRLMGSADHVGHPLALLLADVDWFKNYNDRYGHPAGDECLRRVAAILSTEIDADCGTLARFGGEEFAVLLPLHDLHGARRMAERLCRAVEAAAMPHRAAGDDRQIVTISVGVAALPRAAPEHIEHLIAVADASLYRAKRGGRNAVAATGVRC
ncbi:GGDEF domain-containing protein [Rhizosaccharibacter radicis]|uniref:diguanylate cyclase n=1 Tax=Rhizosaccharibacter radicis TaxID=2782605 RepID=A0ABT1VZP0_9PROT|nr:sensor domain-containing diguanylate cyclase [Acetobacteraceae bacterium KSS12]